MAGSNRTRRHLFISIRAKLLITFFVTFTILAILQSFWYFTITLGFAVDHLHSELAEVERTTSNKINLADLLALAREGTPNSLGFSDDPRYTAILDWLDTVHQVYPSAWPYVFVSGPNPGENRVVVDLNARYNPEQAKKFLQPLELVSTGDELLHQEVYLHISQPGPLAGPIFQPPQPGETKIGLGQIVGEINGIFNTWSRSVSIYGYLRDEQGAIVGGVAVETDDVLISDLGTQIVRLLIFSFFGSLLVMMLVSLQIGTTFTRPIMRLTKAAEAISAGEHESGLAKLQSTHTHGLTVDEIDRLAETFRVLVNFQYALYTISATANTTLDLDGLYTLAYKEIKDLIQADSFLIALYDEKTRKISLFDSSSADALSQKECDQGYCLASPPDLIGYVIQSGQPLMVTRQECKKLVSSGAVAPDTIPTAWLGVPLQTGDQNTFGVLVAQSSQPRAKFSKNDRSLLAFIAGQLAMVVKRIQSETELRQSHQLLEERVEERTAALRSSNQSLQKEIGDRQRAEEEMQKAKEAAEAASIAKSAFLANMSHELRTPLNAILGFSNLMSHDPNLPIHQKEDLGIILQSGEHLLDLINDVLEMSKIEAGRVTLNLASFDLYQLLKEIEEIFRVRASEKGLSLIFEAEASLPRYINSDEKKLRQVLLNILSNAVKFTERGGVTLRSRLQEQLPGGEIHLAFEVEDTGPGIPSEQIEDLFDYFVQAEAGKKSQEGTGLGLSISKNFIRMLGGNISVSSQVGIGSMFAFDLWAALSNGDDVLQRQRERRAIGLEPGQGRWRILVAEDRDENRKLLVKLLQPFSFTEGGQGFEVSEAANGRQAVEIFEVWQPQLIFMDMRMPEMDGHEATRLIRSTTRGQAIVIVALTASAFEEERKLILSEGINDFVRKPFKEHEIFDVLSKHLGVRFVYAEENAAPPAAAAAKPALALAELEHLPADWRLALNHAAAAADGERIHELLQEISRQHPQLSNALEGLALQYRFDLILEASSK